ncbi:L,D-transpeptidase family protein [Prosthecobacter sp. SYSU 5D2]|uniref:L,D-transpeptidase family protein n=1 Tax=Prosthecobacter sp. SYSU 5D2 TaxID=3134134 RepID=UPI0031FE51F4
MHSFTPLPRVLAPQPLFVRLGLTVAAGVMLSHCTSSPKSEVVVSVADQRMGLYEEGVLKKQYVISTSKFGLGDQPNSYRTPTGRHEIIAKIGQGLPPGAVLKSRSWNGEVLKPNAPGRDPIVSRIMWLRGLESSNRNAMRRYIYIHGTTEENRLGQPASYGCIRMGMKDVVDVFDDIGIGAKVVITKDHLPGGKKAEKVKEEPVPEPAAQPSPVTPPSQEPALLAAAPARTGPQTPEKAASMAAAAAAPVPAGPVPVTDGQVGKSSSSFSFLPWSRKSKVQEAPPVAPTAAANPTASKRSDTAPAPGELAVKKDDSAPKSSFLPWSRKSKAQAAPAEAPHTVAAPSASKLPDGPKIAAAPKRSDAALVSSDVAVKENATAPKRSFLPWSRKSKAQAAPAEAPRTVAAAEAAPSVRKLPDSPKIAAAPKKNEAAPKVTYDAPKRGETRYLQESRIGPEKPQTLANDKNQPAEKSSPLGTFGRMLSFNKAEG